MKKIMGKGVVYLVITQLIFVLSNYLIHVGLGRYFGPQIYGTFGVVMSIYLIVGAILNSGIPKAVSKIISSSKNKEKVLRASLSLQVFIGTSISIILIIFAKPIAMVLHDYSLWPFIVLVGFMTIPFSLYCLYMSGFLNGLRMFKAQAITGIIHYITRLIFVFILVWVGYSVLGTFIGYFIAIIIGMIFGFFFLRKYNFRSKVDLEIKKKIWSLAIPLTIIALGFTIIRNVNILFVKTLISNSTKVGYYTAATALSNVPYLISLALPLTLLPSISSAISENNIKLVQKYISQSLRYLLLFLLPILALLSGTAYELVTLLYSSTYAAAAPVFIILSISSTLLAIFMTFGSVLIAGGYQRTKLYIILTSVVILISLHLVLTPQFGIMGAAFSALSASCLACFIAGFIVWKKFGKLTNISSFTKILLSSIILFLVTYYWHLSGIYLIFTYILLSLVYFISLILIGEITKEDFNIGLRIIKSNKN